MPTETVPRTLRGNPLVTFCLSVLPFWSGCQCGEITEPPLCTTAALVDITAPEDGVTFVSGQRVTAQGSIGNIKSVAGTKFYWLLGPKDEVEAINTKEESGSGTLILGETVPDTSVLVVCDSSSDSAPLQNGVTTCVFTVPTLTDGVAYVLRLFALESRCAPGVDDVQIQQQQNARPEVVINEAAFPVRFYANVPVNPFLIAAASDDDTPDAATLRASWTLSGPEDRSFAGAVDSTGAVTIPGDPVLLTPGVYNVEVEVTDAGGQTGTDAATVTVGPANDVPDCQLDAPVADARFIVGDPVSFSGVVSDDQTPVTELSVSVLVGGRTLSALPSGDGAFLAIDDTLPVGSYVATLEVVDDAGAVCRAAPVAFRVDAEDLPPQILSVQATPSDVPVGQDVLLCAQVTDPDDPESALTVTFTLPAPTGPVTVTADGSGDACTLVPAPAGGSYNIEVVASDPSQETDRAYLAFRVTRPPVVSLVSFGPANPTTDDALIVAVTADDPDGDPLDVGFVVRVNGVPQPEILRPAPPASASVSIDPSWSRRGDRVDVVIIAHDGEVDSAPVTTAELVIGNTAPSAPGVQVSPDPAADGADLRCAVVTPSTDADGDVVVYTFAWLRDGAPYTGAGLAQTTSPRDTVLESATTLGETWTCTVTAIDGTDNSPPGSDSALVDCTESTWYADQDLDGFGRVEVAVSACEAPGVTWSQVAGDCDDTEADALPGGTEVPYDGVDQDCLGGDRVDVDEDGSVAVEAGGDDCADDDALISPLVAEVWFDGIDNDCDAATTDARTEPRAGHASAGGEARAASHTFSVSVGDPATGDATSGQHTFRLGLGTTLTFDGSTP